MHFHKIRETRKQRFGPRAFPAETNSTDHHLMFEPTSPHVLSPDVPILSFVYNKCALSSRYTLVNHVFNLHPSIQRTPLSTPNHSRWLPLQINIITITGRYQYLSPSAAQGTRLNHTHAHHKHLHLINVCLRVFTWYTCVLEFCKNNNRGSALCRRPLSMSV